MNHQESPVPFLDLVTPHRELESELVEAFRRSLAGAQFVGGPEVQGFESEFAAYCETPWCAGVNSGTDALRFAAIALGLRPGDEVVTVSHTFIATTEAITQAGGILRLVDIRDDTMTMDPEAVAAAIGPRTVGIVPVHLYGHPADMAPLLDLARRHGLWVLEDAAQAQGARYRGQRAGSMGTMGCFSFYPGKNLGSLGEGGAITGALERHRTLVLQQREHGQSSKYVHESEGYNGRLHAIQAAFLRIKLAHLDRWNRQRREVARHYQARLAGCSDVRLPAVAEDVEPVFHLFVIRCEQRDQLRDFLTTHQVGTGLHYPVPLHLQRAYAHLGMKAGALPVTERAAASLLSLPMFPEMTEHQVDRVAGLIRRFFGR